MNPTGVPNRFVIQHIDGCNTTLHRASPNSRDALLSPGSAALLFTAILSGGAPRVGRFLQQAPEREALETGIPPECPVWRVCWGSQERASRDGRLRRSVRTLRGKIDEECPSATAARNQKRRLQGIMRR